MKKFKLTKEEQWIEDHLEEFVPGSKEEFNLIKRALDARKKDSVLNIRVNSNVLAYFREKARKMGVKYQTLISEVLYRAAHGAKA